MRNDVFSFFGKYRFRYGKQSKNRMCLSPLTQHHSQDHTLLNTDALSEYGIIFSAMGNTQETANVKSISQLSHHVAKLSPIESLNILQLIQGNAINAVNDLSSSEIHKIIDDFSSAARHAFEAGFDGVEIQSTKDSLISQFYSSHTNLRRDEFGGSLENRARFARSIMKACRRVVPKEFLVGCKVAPEDPQMGLDIDESLQMADWLSQDGADFITLSLSNVLLASKKYLHLCDKPILAYFRERLGNHYPLFAAGRIEMPTDAKKAIESGASFVAVSDSL